MRKIISLFVALIAIGLSTFFMSSCCAHKWKDATCTTPKVCIKCGETKGESLGHLWQEATCTEAEICLRCGTRGASAKGHDLSKATCTEAAKCLICGTTVGSPLGHDFVPATCTENGYCSRCNEKGDEATGHDFAPATCEQSETCANCGLTQGEALGHQTENNKCIVCGKVFPTTLSVYQFEDLLKTLPIYVESTKYIVEDTRYKALYPDLLSATVKNNTGKDILSFTVAFVAWDVNNLPVKIIGQYDYNGGSFVTECTYNNVNLIDGKTYGSNRGLAIDSDCDYINTFKAIVVSYTDFDGDTWENPYYGDWEELYSGKRYSDSATIEVIIAQ